MKKPNFLKRALLAATFALAVAVLVPTVNPVEANAATPKVTMNKKYVKASSLKVNKTYKATIKKTDTDSSFVKFKAPKNGTYTITISNLATSGVKSKDFTVGFFGIEKIDSFGRLSTEFVKTKLGKTYYPKLASKYAMKTNIIKDDNKKTPKSERYASSHIVTINLKKNETIYIEMFVAQQEKSTFDIKIKKK